MPRKKKAEKPSPIFPSSQKQTSLSKYFFQSTVNQPDFRKRFSSTVNLDPTPVKVAKTVFTSDEITDTKHENLSPKVLHDDNLSEKIIKYDSSEISVPGSSKSKLSYFAFSKKSKTTEDTEMQVSETVTKDETDAFKSFLMLEEIDSPQKVPSFSQDMSPIKESVKYTPLEKQYLEFQAKYPDAVLLIECGYKYRFFGKDAKIAYKDLNIGCFPYHNFLSASIPVHRLHYHVRRLVLKGHKVAVIKQTESAALKAVSDSRNELFKRELHAMYTKSTFIEEELTILKDENSVEVEDIDDDNAISGYLICVNESTSSKNPSAAVNIACVAVQVSSGDLFYSHFQESLMQNDLESYLMCINPSEILLPSSELSKKTENLIKSFSTERSSRVERVDDKLFEHSFALNNMTKFISSVEETSSSESQENLKFLLTLPPLVISCLSALKLYLSNFKVENILKNVKNLQSFSTIDHMFLNAATIKSLEIFKCNSSFSNHGTLFWFMNQTSTKFGERLLRSWIVKPLKDLQKIEERLNIVTEIIHSDSIIFKKISSFLPKLPDLERLLCSVFYHKCSCYDFLKLVKALVNLKNELFGLSEKISNEIEVPKLKTILLDVLKYLTGIEKFETNIDYEAAKAGDKVRLFLDTSKYISLEKCKNEISEIEKKLNDLRPSICRILRLPAFKYVTVAGQKYLIEVPNSHLAVVPDEWLKISATKQVTRFRSPEVIKLLKLLDQEEERLSEFANEAWEDFLNEFAKEFFKYKKVVSYLSELDVYLTLAKISKEENYCRPSFMNTENHMFHIQQGRHPVVAKLMGEENQFVANDLSLNATERCLIVTGPNMGGKSTYIRSVAIISLMAHIGSFVPAESVTLPVLDGIYVRMGADDDISSRKSTFMLEMSETCSILSSATSKSLVILDELGRGTSTNDGTSIAFTTLRYLLRNVKCFVLFVTHYPTVVELKKYYPTNILTVHMAYILKELDDNEDIQTVTFLYSVVSGISEKSYGINVAALAGISKDILVEAQKKSKEMELKMMMQRQLWNLLQKCEALKFC